ncbi:MAG: transglycosylase SLT domain-containing protein, partial [Nitrospirae bacterium]|nr:transglycosylase SLT domain-containing protein [Nitrospirota bacterium]
VQTAGPSHTRVDALWRIGWLHYQGRAYKVAADAFQRMADRAIDRRETEQARYWKARALEHTGQAHKAQNLYGPLAKDFPMTYYGQLAQSRLRDIPEALDLDEDPLDFSPRTQVHVSHLQRELPYRKAQELQALGLSQEAAGELLWLVSHYTANPDALLELSVQLAKSGAYDAALGLAKRYFQNSLERGHLIGRSGLWPVAYPTVYLPNIRTYVDGNLDPYLVAGIIREESLYNPRALSQVGAIGLMQLMPETATRVARQLGLPPLDREDLFEGDTNIRLGTRYVSQLLGQFRGNLVQAVAAYNAGPEAVSRWISKFGQRDPDEFVELISFRETRRYVKRVITSYRIYLHLLSTRCSAFSLDTVC